MADDLAVDLEVTFRETEHLQRQRALLLVEDAQDHALAVVERRGGDAQVDVDALLRELLEDDAAILRQAALRDVEVAHDLQARHQRARHLDGQASSS